MANLNADFFHKLWDLYDSVRDARFQTKYNAYQLGKVRRRSRNLEILLALLTSTAVGSWTLWGTDPGKEIWAVLLGLATVVAVIKPFLKHSESIERYGKLFMCHLMLCEELKGLAQEIRADQFFSPSTEKAIAVARGRATQLSLDGDTDAPRRLRQRLQNEVNQELPKEAFWVPKSSR